MAKFKVGQRVKIDRKDATITKTNAEGHWDYYYFKFDGDPRERGIHESEISANSSACNALKLEPFNPNSVRLGKSVWYKGREMTYKGKGGGKVHLVDLGGNRIDVPVFDRDLKMLADAYEYYHNDGVPMPNSRVCNSSNPVVRKAMNAVARNSDSQVFAAQAASYFKDAYGGIQGCITCLERLRDYGKPNGFTDKDAESGKKWADKVYDKVVRLSQMMKQGQINSI